MLKNIKDCYNHIPYTWKHYLAFMKMQKQLLGKYKYWFHDWDKLILFIFFPFLGERIINQLHRRINRHHPTYFTGKNWNKHLKNPKKIDWTEAIIDWECARFTKPDKPLNARDTLLKFYPEFIVYAEPYFKNVRL